MTPRGVKTAGGLLYSLFQAMFWDEFSLAVCERCLIYACIRAKILPSNIAGKFHKISDTLIHTCARSMVKKQRSEDIFKVLKQKF